MGKPTEHKAGHGSKDHRSAGFEVKFVVLAQPPCVAEPSEGAFDNPAFRLKAKTNRSSRTLKVCVSVPNNATGAKTCTAEVLPASLPLDLDSGEAAPIMVECELRSDGEIALGTVS